MYFLILPGLSVQTLSQSSTSANPHRGCSVISGFGGCLKQLQIPTRVLGAHTVPLEGSCIYLFIFALIHSNQDVCTFKHVSRTFAESVGIL